MRIPPFLPNYVSVTFYRRHLPHLYRIGQPVFLTWRLHGSLPPHRSFPQKSITSGKAFAAMDRLLDETRSGPFYLRRPEIADMVVETIHHNANSLHRCELHAFVIMPNHVHLLATPHIPLPEFMKGLKGYTAKKANQMLGLTGNPFWQEESYDHLVRDASSAERVRRYIEQNPVRAGLVSEPSQYRWSSAYSGK